MKPTSLLALAVVVGLVGGSVRADELRLDAKTLYERSVGRDVRLAPDGAAIELDEGELFEDDGPAAGYSYRPNEERLGGDVRIKKILHVANPAARGATLLIGPGGDLHAEINGQAIELKAASKAGNYWQAYVIPTEVLRAGANEIVLSGTGRVWIARAEDFAAGSPVSSLREAARSARGPRHPGRSSRSSDGGKTWAVDHLGPAGDIAGEYYVRLFLDHHRPAGSLILPILDAGNLAGRTIAPPLTKPIPIRLDLDADPGKTGSVRLRVRTGTTPIPDGKNWSDWQDIVSGTEIRTPTGRFLQIAVDLTTTNPLTTPRLKGLRLTASPTRGDDWAAKLKVVEVHNPEIIRTAIPFVYEPFDHSRLKELRTRFQLDEVVRGAKTELELIERLARWSAQRWERGHLAKEYPPWNALEILKSHADGTPIGGFCQQYNVVFLQACESFGIPGRAVSIGPGDHGAKIGRGGHEVVEVWSNQFRKWIYVDGNLAWYATDPDSATPLSLWELRQRQMPVREGKPPAPIRVVHLREEGKRWSGLADWPPFLELRLIPRSDFLTRKAPLPLHQGMRGWFWTGHHVWTDPASPASLLYGRRVSERRNWEWTLNQARFTLEATATPGEVRVHLDSETPGFDTFLADIDGTGSKPIASGFVWKLHAGKNRLEVRPRNVAGREGIASRVIVEQP